MSVSKKTILKGLLLLSPSILALLLLGGYWLSKEDRSKEASNEAPVRTAVGIEVRNGVTTLTVDATSQVRSGIETQPLTGTTIETGAAVYGSVIDIQPLLELAGRFASASADLDAAKMELATARAELARVQALYNDEQNVSLRALGAARAADATAAAKTSVAQASVNTTAGTLRQQFGPTIASWATTPQSPELAPFVARREVLGRIVATSMANSPPGTLTIFGDTQTPIEARLVSASPQTDPNVQGQAYFYRAASPLAAGTRVTGRLMAGQQAGLTIPASAIVWYGGQPWAYVRTTPNSFERRAVGQNAPRNGDFLVTDGFKSGEHVVTHGAQLLLSEESRALLSKE